MSVLFGRGTFARLAPEASYASTGAFHTNAIRIIDTSLGSVQQRDGRSHLTTSDGAVRKGFFDTFKECGGNLTTPVYFEGSTMLLKALVGSITTTGSGPYQHVLKSSTTDLDSFTLGLSRGSDANGFETFSGCKISSGTLSLNAGEELQLSIDIIAQDSTTRTTAPVPTYNTTQRQIFHYLVSNTLFFNGQSYNVRSFELTVENSLERRNVLGSKLTLSPDVTDFRTITISVELDAVDNSLYNAMLNGTESAMDIIMTDDDGSGNSMTIKFNNSIITEYADPINTVGRLSQTVTFTALASDTLEALRITIQNSLDGANALNT